MSIEDISQTIEDITKKFGLKLIYIDCTDITLIARIGIYAEAFIEIYANVKKEKLNMGLVVANERIYGIDKEGGFYHEHPFENPLLHIATEQIDIESFVINSFEILKRINLF